MSANPVDSLARKLDRPVATLVVSNDDAVRRFILEALIAAAATYLLKRYGDNYLKGLGFDAMAEEHGRRTRAFFEKLRAGEADEAEINAARADLDAEIGQARGQAGSPHLREAARAELVEMLVEAGAIRAQAEDVAAMVERHFIAALDGSNA